MRLLVSGTTRSLAAAMAVAPDAFGKLLTPANRNSVAWASQDGLPWACDNGCFHRLDAPLFRRMIGRAAGRPGLLWVACPDKLGDARATLELFSEWGPELRAAGVPVAFVGQDGQEDLPVPWDLLDALFVGGSTAWKLSEAAADLMREAKRVGKWVHMGRVNSRRRLEAAYRVGCDSVDGTGFTGRMLGMAGIAPGLAARGAGAQGMGDRVIVVRIDGRPYRVETLDPDPRVARLAWRVHLWDGSG